MRFPLTPKAARDKVIVGALLRLPAKDEIATNANEPMVPIIAANVACQKDIPKPRKNEPYESAKNETFAAAHGQNKERALPLRSDLLMKFMLFNSTLLKIVAIGNILNSFLNNYLGRLRRSWGLGRDFFFLPPPLDLDPR